MRLEWNVGISKIISGPNFEEGVRKLYTLGAADIAATGPKASRCQAIDANAQKLLEPELPIKA
jgi:hypothetical protein